MNTVIVHEYQRNEVLVFSKMNYLNVNHFCMFRNDHDLRCVSNNLSLILQLDEENIKTKFLKMAQIRVNYKILNRIIHEFEIEADQIMKQISQKFSLIIMLFVVSLVCSKAAYSNEDAICKNLFFFGLDNPLEEIAASMEILSDPGGAHPIRLLQKTEDGFLLRSVYGPTFISYNFETEQIMQLGGYGFLPNWVHDASIDVGPEIITHFIGYFLNVGGWQILDVKMSGMEFEEISLFHGQGHEEIEACEAPNCGCVGIAKIYDFDGHLGPTYSILWRR